MYDLHPFSRIGLNLKDVKFAQIFLIWLASFRIEHLSGGMQIQSVQNFKNAAHYDLDAAKVTVPGCACEAQICGSPVSYSGSVRETGISILEHMRAFFGDFPEEVRDNVEYQMDKLTDEDKRYAVQVRKAYGEYFVRRGLELARQRQMQILRD
jgi:glutamate--cysteine ligase